MKLNWQSPHAAWAGGLAIIGVLYALPKLGEGLHSVAYVVNAVPTAYAASEAAQQVDTKFQQYLDAQNANAKAQQAAANAINAYIQQQAQTQGAPAGRREWDDDRQFFWCCPIEDRQACFDRDLWQAC